MSKNNYGFTLLELLIAMAIMGILAATILPRYADYKKRAFDSRARTDLINIAMAQEAYFLDAERYLSCSGNTCSNLPGVTAISPGVNLSITASTLNFTGNSTHSKGSGKIFRWDSNSGGLIN